MTYFGQAALTWSATSESLPNRVHLLMAPLRDVQPAHNMVTFVAESLDRSKRDIFNVAGGAYELMGTVRYDARGGNLADLIKAGASGKTLTYYPNLSDADTKITCVLLSPLSPADVALDPQSGTFGEHSLTIRLRRTDQSAFQPLPRGTDVLFRWAAGESLAAGTFTRTTSTSAPASYAEVGYGTLSTAKTNQARSHWVANPSSMGPRALLTLLLEDQRTNVMRDATNFGTANWTINGGLTRSSAKPDPKGGTAGWRLTASTSAGSFLSQQQTVPSSGQQAVSCFLGPSSNPSSGHILAVTSSAGKRLDLKVSWSSGVPTVTALKGTIWGKPDRWSNGFYRIGGISASSAAFASGKKITLRLYPTSTVASPSKGTLAVYGAQAE